MSKVVTKSESRYDKSTNPAADAYDACRHPTLALAFFILPRLGVFGRLAALCPLSALLVVHLIFKDGFQCGRGRVEDDLAASVAVVGEVWILAGLRMSVLHKPSVDLSAANPKQ